MDGWITLEINEMLFWSILVLPNICPSYELKERKERDRISIFVVLQKRNFGFQSE
jgi:hypothetical protein